MEPPMEAANRKVVSNDDVRKFIIPNLNLIAKAYQQQVNLNDPYIGQPPAILHMSDAEIEAFRSHPLILNHPCPCFTGDRIVSLFTQHVVGGDVWVPAYIN